MRQGIQILAMAFLLVLVGLVAYQLLFAHDTYSLLVKASRGATLRGPDGTTRALTAGDVVSVGERVQTDAGGSAVVASGESELALKGNTDIRIKSLDEDGMEIEIENDGGLQAHVRHGSASVRISNGGRSVYATDADFEVAADRDGTLAVDTTRGDVSLDGFGPLDRARAGERVIAMPETGAIKGAIPDKLLLEVAWPDETVTREASVRVHGKTDPYARVKVGRDGAWREVRADASGAFVTDIALDEGRNPVEVRARDAMGEEETAATEIERRTRAPSGTVGVDYTPP